MKITDIQAEQILDSRGNPTLLVTVIAGDYSGSCGVPSGARTGRYEALELRDRGPDYGGKGVTKALDMANGEVRSALIGTEVTDQAAVDSLLRSLDGTENFSQIGGNVAIGVSIAAARAAAAERSQQLFEYIAELSGNQPELPRIFVNMINGGRHADMQPVFQEYLCVPQHDDFNQALRFAQSTQDKLEALIQKRGYEHSIGDEGGFVISTDDVTVPLQLIEEACGDDLIQAKLSLDVAASEFTPDEGQQYDLGDSTMSRSELIHLYQELETQFPIFSIEDPLFEGDTDGFAECVTTLTSMVVGDDITVTNPIKVRDLIGKQAINAVIIKPNQVGTLTDTVAAVQIAHENNILCIASHRSGETMDDWIADVAVGLGCYGIKAGGFRQPERMAKYQRLQTINEHIS
jgi:enolase